MKFLKTGDKSDGGGAKGKVAAGWVKLENSNNH